MQNTITVTIRILFLSFMCVQVLYSQSLIVNTRIAPADIINAGSLFDPMADKIKDIPMSSFSLTFTNTTSPLQDIRATMYIETYVTLDEDRIRMPLYTLKSRTPFVIPTGGRVFIAGDTRNENDMQFVPAGNDANVQRIKDMIWNPTSGGRIPSGTYEIIISLTVVQIGTQSAHELLTVNIPPIVVTNPSIAALIVPSENGYNYPTPFPQFQWTYDTRSVMLSVYEKRPDQQSLEDATQASDPYLQVTIDREISHGMSLFTYPQSGSAPPGIDILKGPRPLEQGKTYVIVLEGVRTAFGMSVDPLRTIRSFTIDNPRNRAGVRSYTSLFPLPEYQRVLDLLYNGNVQVVEDGITLNNDPISLQQLLIFLGQNKERKFSIHIE